MSEDARPPLDAGMRTSIEGALEIVRKRDPGMHGLIHNLCRLAAWLDGHPERDDGIRSYYPGFETVVRTEDLERVRAKLVEQDVQLTAAKPAMALIEHAKKLVREGCNITLPKIESEITRVNEGYGVSTESHNRIVPEIVKKLVRESDGETDCMVALESVVLGVMLYYRPNPRHAGEFMDSMTAAIIDRMKP